MYKDQYDLLSKLSKSDLIKTKIIKTNKAVRCVINCFRKMLGKYGYFFKDSYFNKIKASLYIKNNVKKYDYIISYHASCTNNIIKFANPKSKDKMIMWYHGSTYNKWAFKEYVPYLFSKIVAVNDICAEVICRHNPALTDKITAIENLVPYREILEKTGVAENLFDKDFFNSRNELEVHQTPKSYCAHNYAGSWAKKQERKSIKSFLPKWLIRVVYIIGQKTWARNKYSWFQIPFEK